MVSVDLWIVYIGDITALGYLCEQRINQNVSSGEMDEFIYLLTAGNDIFTARCLEFTNSRS